MVHGGTNVWSKALGGGLNSRYKTDVRDLPEAKREEILNSLGFEPWAAFYYAQDPNSRYDDKRKR